MICNKLRLISIFLFAIGMTINSMAMNEASSSTQTTVVNKAHTPQENVKTLIDKAFSPLQLVDDLEKAKELLETQKSVFAITDSYLAMEQGTFDIFSTFKTLSTYFDTLYDLTTKMKQACIAIEQLDASNSALSHLKTYAAQASECDRYAEAKKILGKENINLALVRKKHFRSFANDSVKKIKIMKQFINAINILTRNKVKTDDKKAAIDEMTRLFNEDNHSAQVDVNKLLKITRDTGDSVHQITEQLLSATATKYANRNSRKDTLAQLVEEYFIYEQAFNALTPIWALSQHSINDINKEFSDADIISGGKQAAETSAASMLIIFNHYYKYMHSLTQKDGPLYKHLNGQSTALNSDAITSLISPLLSLTESCEKFKHDAASSTTSGTGVFPTTNPYKAIFDRDADRYMFLRKKMKVLSGLYHHQQQDFDDTIALIEKDLPSLKQRAHEERDRLTQELLEEDRAINATRQTSASKKAAKKTAKKRKEISPPDAKPVDTASEPLQAKTSVPVNDGLATSRPPELNDNTGAWINVVQKSRGSKLQQALVRDFPTHTTYNDSTNGVTITLYKPATVQAVMVPSFDYADRVTSWKEHPEQALSTEEYKNYSSIKKLRAKVKHSFLDIRSLLETYAIKWTRLNSSTNEPEICYSVPGHIQYPNIDDPEHGLFEYTITKTKTGDYLCYHKCFAGIGKIGDRPSPVREAFYQQFEAYLEHKQEQNPAMNAHASVLH